MYEYGKVSGLISGTGCEPVGLRSREWSMHASRSWRESVAQKRQHSTTGGVRNKQRMRCKPALSNLRPQLVFVCLPIIKSEKVRGLVLCSESPLSSYLDRLPYAICTRTIALQTTMLKHLETSALRGRPGVMVAWFTGVKPEHAMSRSPVSRYQRFAASLHAGSASKRFHYDVSCSLRTCLCIFLT